MGNLEITVLKNEKTRTFGELDPGDAFYVVDNLLEHDAGSPAEPYIKICDSHGGVKGAGFSLTNCYEDEFNDTDIIGVYDKFEIVLGV